MHWTNILTQNQSLISCREKKKKNKGSFKQFAAECLPTPLQWVAVQIYTKRRVMILRRIRVVICCYYISIFQLFPQTSVKSMITQCTLTSCPSQYLLSCCKFVFFRLFQLRFSIFSGIITGSTKKYRSKSQSLKDSQQKCPCSLLPPL